MLWFRLSNVFDEHSRCLMNELKTLRLKQKQDGTPIHLGQAGQHQPKNIDQSESMRSLLKDQFDGYNRPRRQPPLRYDVDPTRITDERLRWTFLQSDCDLGTSEWLSSMRNPSFVREWLSSLLSACCSRTTSNGIAHRGGMHVLSVSQASRLLSGLLPPPRQGFAGLTLLDIGAGDGGVTKNISHLFAKVYATEASAAMRWRLGREGFVASNMPDTNQCYDCVALFNVLDRCDEPRNLLKDVVDKYVVEGGAVVIAVVLPWCPFVEDGTRKRAPAQVVPMVGARCADKASFETCVNVFVNNLLRPAGLQVERWTRVPYLCQGNLTTHEYFVLDNAVFACRVVRE